MHQAARTSDAAVRTFKAYASSAFWNQVPVCRTTRAYAIATRHRTAAGEEEGGYIFLTVFRFAKPP